MNCRFKLEGGRMVCEACGAGYILQRFMSADPSHHHRLCTAAVPCPHLGDKIGGMRGTGCGGKPFTLPVFSCGLFGTCTERPAEGETFVELSPDHRACQGCQRERQSLASSASNFSASAAAGVAG